MQTTPQKLAEISVQPLSQTVALGAPMTLQVVATGNQLTYQWFANGVAIPGATNPSYTDGSVQESDAVKYTVKVTSDSQGANPLTVESLPAIIQIGADSPAVDKFKNAPRLGGQTQLQSLEREPGKQAGGSVARGYSGAQVFNTFGPPRAGRANHADIIGGASQWFTYVAPQNGTVQ